MRVAVQLPEARLLQGMGSIADAVRQHARSRSHPPRPLLRARPNCNPITARLLPLFCLQRVIGGLSAPLRPSAAIRLGGGGIGRYHVTRA